MRIRTTGAAACDARAAFQNMRHISPHSFRKRLVSIFPELNSDRVSPGFGLVWFGLVCVCMRLRFCLDVAVAVVCLFLQRKQVALEKQGVKVWQE
jgi:hypothetical protein